MILLIGIVGTLALTCGGLTRDTALSPPKESLESSAQIRCGSRWPQKKRKRNARYTPKRRRTDCPVCKKNVSYTIPYHRDTRIQMTNERYGHATLIRHKNEKKEWCETGGIDKFYPHLDKTKNIALPNITLV